MHHPRLVLAALLLAAPLLSRAQAAADAPPAPRFYVGLGAYSSFYQKLGGQAFLNSTSNSQVRLPLQLTAGYQLRPRLALQVGLAYSGQTTDYAYTTNSFYGIGYQVPYSKVDGAYTERHASTTALVRYTLTRKPEHRLQFDLLGGLTLEHQVFNSRGTRADSVQGSLTTGPFRYHFSDNALLLTLGAGARFRLSQHFDLTYDLTLNGALTSDAVPFYKGSTTSSALGVRYRFGQR